MHKRRGLWREIRMGRGKRREEGISSAEAPFLPPRFIPFFPPHLHADPSERARAGAAILPVTDRQATTTSMKLGAEGRHNGGRRDGGMEGWRAHAASDDRRAAGVQQSDDDKCNAGARVALVTAIDILGRSSKHGKGRTVFCRTTFL